MNSSIIQIQKEADVYLKDSKTVKEAASKLGISKRTFQLHMKKLKELNPSLHKLVLEKQESNIKEGRIIGSQKGKRLPTYTKEEALSIANLIITKQYTYQEVEQETGIPSSTIYDMVHSSYIEEEIKNKLALIASLNQKGMTIEEYEERRRNK